MSSCPAVRATTLPCGIDEDPVGEAAAAVAEVDDPDSSLSAIAGAGQSSSRSHSRGREVLSSRVHRGCHRVHVDAFDPAAVAEPLGHPGNLDLAMGAPVGEERRSPLALPSLRSSRCCRRSRRLPSSGRAPSAGSFSPTSGHIGEEGERVTVGSPSPYSLPRRCRREHDDGDDEHREQSQRRLPIDPVAAGFAGPVRALDLPAWLRSFEVVIGAPWSSIRRRRWLQTSIMPHLGGYWREESP